MRKLLALLSLPFVAGCHGPPVRTIRTAGVDPSSGTAYAFEVNASDRTAETTVIVCNVALPAICYRIRVDRLDQPDGLRAVQRLLEQARRQQALDRHPAVALPDTGTRLAPPIAPEAATPPMSIDF